MWNMDMNLIIVYDKLHNIYLECDVPNSRKVNSFEAERKNNSFALQSRTCGIYVMYEPHQTEQS